MASNALRTARRVRNKRFYLLVQHVVSSLPIHVKSLLENVAIVVEAEPSSDQRRDNHVAREDDLFGLYQGIPQSERGSGYSMVLPDRITIFMGPLQRACRTQAVLEEQVRITVLHELGHHLGFDEDGLAAIGLS
jgi:predicted Zn-dependent protease with MMP-like domain